MANDFSKITIDGTTYNVKVPNKLTVGSKTFDGSSAVTIEASDLGLSNALQFIGETTTALSDGSTTSSIKIGSTTHTAATGDVVLYGAKEFVWQGSMWKELGDGSSHALKTISISAGSGLTGGGTLEANRTISHADTSSQASISASGRRYITGVTLDGYGHVTGLTTGTETVTAPTTPSEVGAAPKKAGVYLVKGNTTGTAGTWTGTSSDFTDYYDGLVVAYDIGIAGATTTTLNINGNGAKTVYLRGTTKLTTHYAVGTIILLVYSADADAWYKSDYDSNGNTTIRVYRQDASGYNKDYPLIASRTVAADLGTVGTESSYEAVYGLISDTNANIPTTNPYTGESKFKTVTATTFNGDLSGNATTATTADNATKLNGQDASHYENAVTSVNSKTGAVSLGASDVGALSLDGGTINKSKTVKMDASANSNGANLKWGTVNSKSPYIGYASDQTDGTFVIGSLLGTNYASGLAIGGGSGNLLWKGTKVATTSDIPSVPTVNNGTLTIQKNGTSVGTFTANQSGNTTANITVPTTASDVNALPISGGTVAGTSGDTPLYIKSAHATSSYEGFQRTDGTTLGYFGYSSKDNPSVYLSSGAKTIYHAGNLSSATTSAAGLMSAADKEIVNRFTYDGNTPQLYIDAGACQIDMNDDAIRISAAGGLYYDGNEVAVKSELWNLSDRIAAGTGNRSVTIGYGNTVNGSDSVAIGYDNEVGSDYSFATGTSNTVSGLYSSAFGRSNVASGSQSTAIGYHNTASGSYSLATGYYNTAGAYQTVIGRRATTTYTGPTSTSSTAGSLFIIGKGTSASALSNAFRVMTSGAVYGAAAYNSSGADYAEMWEWADGNPNNEDRRGKFVTVDENNKIRIATTDDEYILGIISATPCVVGDVQSENWREMYLKDVFGQPIVKKVDVPEHIDEETGELVKAHTEEQWVLNPEYDPTRPYVSRDERKEWAAVGLMGKLVVIDDGTCVAGRYCKLTGNGTATSSTDKNDWRVLRRMDSTHVQILYR